MLLMPVFPLSNAPREVPLVCAASRTFERGRYGEQRQCDRAYICCGDFDGGVRSRKQQGRTHVSGT